MRAESDVPRIASCASWGSRSSAWLTCCTAWMSPTRVIASSSTSGTNTKKMLPRITIGPQKSRAWASWRRSVRAIVLTRNQFIAPASFDGHASCDRCGVSGPGRRSRDLRASVVNGSTRVTRAPAATSASTRSGTRARWSRRTSAGPSPSSSTPSTPSWPASDSSVDGSVVGDADDGVGPVAAGAARPARPGDHVTSALEHDDLVGQTFGFEQEMGAHHDRAALAGHLVDEVEHRERRLRVEARGRLVVEQQIRIVEHRPRQRETCLHPGGVAADLLVERVRDAEPLGGRGRCRSRLAP